MLLYRKRLYFSLSNEYFLFTAIILALVCVLSAIFCVYSYYLYSNQKTESMKNLSNVVANELTEILEENENILKFFGHKIADKIDPKDLNGIANLLVSTVDLNIKKMTKSYISWVNIEGDLTVSGKDGILNKDFPSIRNRKYFITAKKYPWSMQISDPDKSIFSNNDVLPTGIGIQNKLGKFIGYLVLGLRIDHINRHILNIVNPQKLSYVLFNNDCNFIASSETYQHFKASPNFQTISDLVANSSENKFIPVKFSFNNFEYSYLIKMSKYPFSILIGFDLNYYKQEFLHQVSLRLGEFLLIGLFCLILLYFFRKKIILPIKGLSDVALEISRGELNVTIPTQYSIEMRKLSRGLSQVVRSMQRTENYKKQLELANKIAKDSDLARSDFIKKMQYEFGTYLKEIYVYSHLIFKHLKHNSILNEEILEYTSKIQEIVTLIYSKTSTNLELKHFSLISTLEEAIKINMKLSFLKEINIITNVPEDLPELYADEFRIKQILISLLYKSIENSPKNSKIFLNISHYSKKGKIWFQITIKDQSFGLDENELNDMEEKFNENDSSIFEFTKMKMQHIEKLIIMHKGRMQIMNKLNEGRTVELFIPLLVKEPVRTSKNNVVYI